MQVLTRLNTLIFTWMACLLGIVLAVAVVRAFPRNEVEPPIPTALIPLRPLDAPIPNELPLRFQNVGEPWIRLTDRFEFCLPEREASSVVHASGRQVAGARFRNDPAAQALQPMATVPQLLPVPATPAVFRPRQLEPIASASWIPPAPSPPRLSVPEPVPRTVAGTSMASRMSVIMQARAEIIEESKHVQPRPPAEPVPKSTSREVIKTVASPMVQTVIAEATSAETPRRESEGWKGRRSPVAVSQLQPILETPPPPFAPAPLPPVPAPPILSPENLPREELIPPSPEGAIPLPFESPRPLGELHVNVTGGRISLTAREAPLDSLLSLIAQQHGLSIVGSGMGDRRITVTLTQVPLQQALDSILKVNGFHWRQEGDILIVSPLTANSGVPAHVQGRQMKVFELDYMTAADADRVVKGLLSPVGQSFILESSSTDKRRTREQIVVEDLLENLIRVESYLKQADVPPRQVLIEAKVFRVDLGIEERHGVNLSSLAELANAQLSFRTTGFANPAASPSLIVGMDGTDLDSVLELLTSTTNAKTLASPKVLAVNGQEARIQVGQQLGYFETLTTQTGTFQSVKFLDTGVVLNVTPVISSDGNVLMTVKPEVSSGQINPVTGLPEEETSEVETTVLLADGYGMVIGGLIQESDVDAQNKVTVLGDLWGIGGLFRRTVKGRTRGEIIVALVPHIVPYPPDKHCQEQRDVLRATTPLVGEDLVPIDRRGLEPEPVLSRKLNFFDKFR